MKTKDFKLSARTKHKLAALIFEHSKNTILITNDKHKIVLVNPVFTEITGYSPEDVIGKDPKVVKSGKHDRVFYQSLWSELIHNGYWQGTIWNRRKSGEIYPEWQTIHVVKDKQGKITNYFAIFSDITDSKLLQEELQQLKNYDALTKLPNRLLFLDRLKNAIAALDITKYRLALLYLNINKFKEINDAYGMPVGDEVLKDVALRVENVLRKDTTFTRIAGDNYLILLQNIKEDTEIISTVDRVLNTFKSAFKIYDNTFYLQAKIGVAIADNKQQDPDEFIKQADLALEKAKYDEAVSVAFFDPNMGTELTRRLAMQTELYRAISKNELELYYQPQVNISNGKIVGAEALLRWNHPKKGVLLPGAFLDIAVSSGLIIPIGKWVINAACKQVANWQQDKLSAITVAVNVSAKQFKQKNFVGLVKSAIKNSGANPENIELELTEQIMLDNIKDNVKMLKQLSSAGIKTSIDDFGTGYSSLNYLSRFPLTKLKIDISFVRHMVDNHDDRVIVKTIIQMARNLSLSVVAEGVETKEQLDILRDMDCDEIQGFYASSAVPANEFTELLRKDHRFF